ncbi:amino acid ABC transporter permease [Cellulomonas sp. URHD0024]|uniref:amino acid ABC transporter permease n=1 Tax=Cellulomonas sp. URHD0024 TaxID=1302620 RepID=UPI0005580051|nr:amino acid ABC transporter permease [Cellulomonas sp. URHD0024]
MSTPTTADTQSRVPERIHAVPVRYPGRWVSAVVVLVLAAMVANALITNDAFHWPTVGKYIFSEPMLRGVRWTIWLTVASMAIAIVLAVLLAVMRRSSNPVMRYVSWVYIWFFRGTPIYVQLIFWGLISVLYRSLSVGVPFGPEFFHFTTATAFTASRLAILGLALNEAAYLAEIVRAGLQSVDSGQSEAARALGMSDGRILWRIVLPQAMRVIVPPTGNETISMLKTTSLVVAVPFTLELNSAQQNIGSRIFLPVPLLVAASLWYLAITSVLMIGQSYLERYYGKGFDTQVPTKRGRKPRVPKQVAINAAHTTHDLGPTEGHL